MELHGIITGLETQRIWGDREKEVKKVTFDSRDVDPGSMFVAVRGTATDGHRYIPQARERGAAVILCEEEPPEPVPEVTWIRVSDSRKALAGVASAFYGHPSRELHLVGITGTNGKTTVASLLHQLHTLLGFRSGLLSTVRVLVGDREHPATHTTPDPLVINARLRDMVGAGCEYCFMEVSSHATDQSRTEALDFNGGVFTNLTRDHLDYHKDFKTYLTAKKKFFDQLPGEGFALINGDDRNGRVMVQNCRARVHEYSLRMVSDFAGRIREMHLDGTQMEIGGREVWIRLPGRFNAYNILCVYGTAVLLGQHPDDAIRAVSRLQPVDGRFNAYRTPGGITCVVDYAHTPDALENVLETIQEVNVAGAEVITVVGAGGDRDRGKRPDMARIAVQGSSRVILTSDNPRNEDPNQILDDMMKGVPGDSVSRTLRIESREEAIRTACMMASPGSVILVAGKGHERTQEIGGAKVPFDDMEILKKNLPD